MQVLILGINHQIQWVRIFSSSTGGVLERFEESQKAQFRELLRRTIVDRKVQFIGEEAKHGEPSIVQAVCDSNGCGYANIEMHPDERVARSIFANYDSDSTLLAEQKERFHQEREKYMFGRAVAESRGAENIMVICGRHHRSALAKEFREASHQVDEQDIQAEPWYVEDWMTHMMRL